jgi:hypothetical protein
MHVMKEFFILSRHVISQIKSCVSCGVLIVGSGSYIKSIDVYSYEIE